MTMGWPALAHRKMSMMGAEFETWCVATLVRPDGDVVATRQRTSQQARQ